ncbi:hypothetical protein [uncultured Allomuricauda sp.]|uniref:hypothetical protein n=1 Tax=Allomuricauda sp. R78024 TaxID=3093867 RepID=UPI0026139507|nr:hypothetical protein [uncultured Allomuricauda sp.]
MKNFKIYVLLAMAVFVTACSEDDKITLLVQDTVTAGAVLRTLDSSGSLDMFDTASVLSFSIQEQDAEGGALLDRVEITGSYVDNNGTDDDSVSGAALATIAASEFGELDGLPTFDYSLTLAEFLTAVGIPLTQVLPGDQFVVDMELFLTDGRSFKNEDTTGNVSGGSFFSSPYRYTETVDDGISLLLPFLNDGINVADKTGINIAPTATNDIYSVQIRIDDGADGALLNTLTIFREFVDRTIEDGDPDLSEAEAELISYDISSLTSDADGVRTVEFTRTLEELYGATLTFADLGINDEFNLRFEFETADGRIVTTNAPDTENYVQINVLECTLLNADAPFPGEYTINFFDSFGDGWDGAQITVSIDGGSAASFTLGNGSSGNSKFTVPEGATSLVVSYVPGAFESEHSYNIADPNGNQAAVDNGGALGPVVGTVGIAVCE